ncbi:MAG: cupin-like domain-containing protein [Phycisphaerae bacterium]|nr:cupin-like domain-containing protein [Saprospiraceae bacterium]
MELQPIERRSGLTRESFAQAYLEPLKPVVFTDLTAHWPAIKKWTIEYFKEKYGDMRVPVVSNNFSRPGRGYLAADMHITFREYLEILESGPSDLRIFAWNIFWKAPELREDFKVHDIMDGFVDEVPFFFFGCEGSRVSLHYDVDMSHVFLTQLHGRKRVILFPPDQSRHLYRLPFTVASHVNVLKPDYEKYPALLQVKGQEVILMPGETLFIPRGTWHYIEYTDGGYSISLRAFNSMVSRMQGLASITKNYAVDRLMNRFMGKRWYNLKIRLAQRRAEKKINRKTGKPENRKI